MNMIMNLHIFVFAKFAQTPLIGKELSHIPKGLFHGRYQHLLQKCEITKTILI